MCVFTYNLYRDCTCVQCYPDNLALLMETSLAVLLCAVFPTSQNFDIPSGALQITEKDSPWGKEKYAKAHPCFGSTEMFLQMNKKSCSSME